jgi:hypothetical protein
MPAGRYDVWGVADPFVWGTGRLLWEELAMKRMLSAFVLAVPLALGLSLRHAAATHDRVGAYALFAGSWYHHGFSLQVTAEGTVVATYRLYSWCGATQRFGCDRLAGNQIYAGGLWVASLQKPSGGTASGLIGASADTSLDATTIVLLRRPHDVLLLTWGPAGHRMHTALCGPQAPASVCGA